MRMEEQPVFEITWGHWLNLLVMLKSGNHQPQVLRSIPFLVIR